MKSETYTYRHVHGDKFAILERGRRVREVWHEATAQRVCAQMNDLEGSAGEDFDPAAYLAQTRISSLKDDLGGGKYDNRLNDLLEAEESSDSPRSGAIAAIRRRMVTVQGG